MLLLLKSYVKNLDCTIVTLALELSFPEEITNWAIKLREEQATLLICEWLTMQKCFGHRVSLDFNANRSHTML